MNCLTTSNLKFKNIFVKQIYWEFQQHFDKINKHFEQEDFVYKLIQLCVNWINFVYTNIQHEQNCQNILKNNSLHKQ